MQQLVEWLATQSGVSIDPALLFEWRAPLYKGHFATFTKSLSSFSLPFPDHLSRSFDDIRIAGAWSAEGLIFSFSGIDLDVPCRLDLWLDTKPSAQVMHRYVHHFVCLIEEGGHLFLHEEPLSIGGIYREACPPALLTGHFIGSSLMIRFPAAALFGYNPEEGAALKMAFRYTSEGGKTVVFPTGPEIFCEHSTQLWALFELISK